MGIEMLEGSIQELSSIPTFRIISRKKQKLVLEAVSHGFTASQFSTFALTLEKPGHDGLRIFDDGKACNLLLVRTRNSDRNIRNIKDLRKFLGML